MITNSQLITYSGWFGIATIAFAILTIVAFILKWGIRFRLVGVTSFMGVLTGGIFALGLGLFTHQVIPGSVRYSLVYDTGASQTVIAVAPTVTESELEATMRQAASDLYSPGRVGAGGDKKMTIRVRTIIHPENGVSEPLYLGEVRRALGKRDDDNMELDIFRDKLQVLKKYQA
jgi:hypothetical protein